MLIKAVTQRCDSATLIKDGLRAKIGKGIILYIAFLKETTKEDVNKFVDSMLFGIGNLVATPPENKEKYDILIIPQASLGGRQKGKTMQYHALIEKDVGEDLYEHLIGLIGAKCTGKVLYGNYGSLQCVEVVSNGPLCHILEL